MGRSTKIAGTRLPDLHVEEQGWFADALAEIASPVIVAVVGAARHVEGPYLGSTSSIAHVALGSPVFFWSQSPRESLGSPLPRK